MEITRKQLGQKKVESGIVRKWEGLTEKNPESRVSYYRDLVDECRYKTNTKYNMNISPDILKSIFD